MCLGLTLRYVPVFNANIERWLKSCKYRENVIEDLFCGGIERIAPRAFFHPGAAVTVVRFMGPFSSKSNSIGVI